MNDNSPAYLLHKLVFDLDRAADRLLQAEVGISYKRLLFLALVPPHGQLVQHELAQALGYSDPAVSTMLQTLTKEGYLTTSPSPAHGRKRLVTLTPRGRRLVSKSRRLLDARFAALLAAAKVDLDHYVALTTRISAVLNAPPGQEPA